MTHSATGFVFVLSSFMESTLTIIMAASLPVSRANSHASDGSALDRMRQTASRASTAFWHDRGNPEDMEIMKPIYRPRSTLAAAVVVSSRPTIEWHRHAPSGDPSAMSYGDIYHNTTERYRGGVEVAQPAPKDLKTSLFNRTWSTISSALQDLEPLWAHRRMEAAMRHFSRPYTPSVYSSWTMDDDFSSTLTMKRDSNHIINRLSDIVEESWRDRSILKTPEPAALIYSTEKEYPPEMGSKSDWDIENGSMI